LPPEGEDGARAAWGDPEAVLLRVGGAEVSPSARGLVESQARGAAEGDAEGDDAVAEGDARIASGAHARLGEGVLRCAGCQAVVVGYPERGVGGERLARQRRLGRGRCWRPAHGGGRDRRVGAPGRAGGGGGGGRA